jgi:hypothetical protein
MGKPKGKRSPGRPRYNSLEQAYIKMDHREACSAVDWVHVYEDSNPGGGEVLCNTLMNLRIQYNAGIVLTIS